MGLKKWLARKGAVGGTARWAGQAYNSLKAANPGTTLEEIMHDMVTDRYSATRDQATRDTLLKEVDGGQFSGLGALVVSILVREAGFGDNTEENRAMFSEVIDEELLKEGVPEEVVFDSERAISALEKRLQS